MKTLESHGAMTPIGNYSKHLRRSTQVLPTKGVVRSLITTGSALRATGAIAPVQGASRSTAPGPRTVPVRSMSARWGGLQKVSAFVPGHALRTGTVRGPPGAVPRCAHVGASAWIQDWSADGHVQPCPRVPGFRPSSRGQGCPRSGFRENVGQSSSSVGGRHFIGRPQRNDHGADGE